MLSKKDFDAIARNLKNTKPRELQFWATHELVDYEAKLAQWVQDVTVVAIALGSTNNLFSKERFLIACGVTP